MACEIYVLSFIPVLNLYALMLSRMYELPYILHSCQSRYFMYKEVTLITQNIRCRINIYFLGEEIY